MNGYESEIDVSTIWRNTTFLLGQGMLCCRKKPCC